MVRKKNDWENKTENDVFENCAWNIFSMDDESTIVPAQIDLTYNEWCGMQNEFYLWLYYHDVCKLISKCFFGSVHHILFWF